jgi:UDP-2,4-diacetamido-2,4,6-trideoxy-beta-L-altropyranose hydrolase
MVIDDLAERPLDCDLLLNQNLAQHEKAQQYQSLISKACETLFGPRYALLSSNFRMLHESVQPHSGHVRRALIAMGGSDPGNSTALVVEAMSASQFQHIELDVIVGVNFAHREQIAELLSRRGNANLRGPLPSLVVAMAAADIAIGAGGTMSWERMCLGLPTIVISIAENQVSGCRALDSARVAIYAGSIDELTTPALITVLQTVLTDSALLREMSQRGLSIVDGQGASRVADRLTERA